MCLPKVSQAHRRHVIRALCLVRWIMENELVVSEQFSLSEGLTLEQCERDIEIADQLEELAHYVKGKRLEAIKENWWYKNLGYKTFDSYCRERWNISGSHGLKLIEVSKVIENIKMNSTMTNQLPTTQRQTWGLIGLEPKQQVEAWNEAVETAPNGGVSGISVTQEKKVSGRHVQETVDRLYPKDDKSGPAEEVSTNHHRFNSSVPPISPSIEKEQPKIIPAEPKWTESELERKKAVLNGETVVANKKTDKTLIRWAQENGLYIAIDRGSIWGNPFVLPGDGTRAEVIDNYKWYYTRKPSLLNKIDTLNGKVLGCWCYPLPCHGDVLKGKSNGN